MKLDKLLVVLSMAMALTIVIGCSGDDGNGPVPLDTNVVWAEKVTATAGETGIRVKVQFANLEPLSGIAVPLRVSGSGFTIDSVSFANGRVVDATVLESHIDTLTQTVAMVALFGTELVPRGKGVFASLYFSLYQDSQGQVLVIDTATVGTESLVYVDSTGQGEIDPEFEAGEISVLF